MAAFLYQETDTLDHFSLKDIKKGIKKVAGKAKDVVSDSAKLAVNSVTRPILLATGKEPIYSSEEMRTGFGKTGDRIQTATTAAGASIVGDKIGMTKSGPSGADYELPPASPYTSEQTLEEMLKENAVPIGAGVVGLFFILILLFSK